MRTILAICIVCLGLLSCTTAKVNKEETAVLFQEELLTFYTNPKTTPLIEEEITNFKGITFFPIDEKYKVKAKFTAVVDGKVIPFPTSAKKIKHYKVYGLLMFELNGKTNELTLYQSYPLATDDTHLFLPFMDETSGVTSYGGGRYIDFSLDQFFGKSMVTIDFNRAYNPYCAYSKHYNCPIPPSDNALDIEINAGVSY